MPPPVLLFLGWVNCCFLGLYLGGHRERPALGMFLGATLGPFGLVATLLLPFPELCPQCLDDIPAGARRCRHCGQPVPRCPDCGRPTDPELDPACERCGAGTGLAWEPVPGRLSPRTGRPVRGGDPSASEVLAHDPEALRQ